MNGGLTLVLTSQRTRGFEHRIALTVVGKTPVAVAAVSSLALQLYSRVHKELPPGL